MIKLLLLLVAVVLVVWWIKRLTRPDEPPTGPAAPDAGSATAISRESILACVHCGVHVPSSEALMLGDRPFCSEAHRQAHQGDVTP